MGALPERAKGGGAAVVAVLALAVWLLRRLAKGDGAAIGRLLVVGSVLVVAYCLLAVVLSVTAGGTRRTIVARPLLAVLAAGVVLGLLEVPSFCFGYDWRRLLARQDELFVGRAKAWKNPWNVPDDELVYRRPHNLHIAGEAPGDSVGWLGVAQRPPYPFDLNYDGRGYRNERTLDRATVAVVGDSFVEAALVPIDQVVTTRLEQALGAPVVNLGVGGYGPQQELVVLRRDALPLEPRLVFWFFFEGNDLVDASRFEREAHGDVVYRMDYWKRSFYANAVALVAQAFAAPRTEDSVEARKSSGTIRVAGRDQGAKVYFPYPHRPLSAEDRRTVDVVTGLLGDAQRACTERGAAFVAVFVPEKFRVYREFCDFPSDGHCNTWEPSDLPEQLAAWAGRSGVSFHDLTPLLQQAAAKGELLYFADDGHWNRNGHALVAQSLAALARERLAAGAAR